MIITYPNTAAFAPREFWLGIRSNVLIRTSSLNGSITTSQIPGTRLMARVALRNNTDASDYQPDVEAFFAGLEGQANRLSMHHLHRPEPRGTMRGTPTAGGAARGARGMVVFGSSGTTLRPGDMLGVTTSMGPQLIMIRSATGTGAVTTTFSPPLRGVVEAGSPVEWDAPKTTWISTQPEIMVGYVMGQHPGVTLELMEDV